VTSVVLQCVQAEDFAIQEENRGKRLVLCPGGDVPSRRQLRDEVPVVVHRDDRTAAHCGAGFVQIGEEPADPVKVGLLGTVRVVADAECFAHDGLGSFRCDRTVGSDGNLQRRGGTLRLVSPPEPGRDRLPGLLDLPVQCLGALQVITRNNVVLTWPYRC